MTVGNRAAPRLRFAHMPARPRPVDPAQYAFERYSQHVYRFLLKRTGNHHDAEELTQRVFAEAAETLSDQAAPTSLLGWLYAVAERRFIDEVRRRSIARRTLPLLAESPVAPDLAYSREIAAVLKQAIAALPAEQRIVVVRKVIQGDSFADIADELSISVDACKMRLSRAIATLREELRELGLRPDSGA
jgi:RNA polymerase sigma-70 factor, ECF subfamily